ncbi:MAG TPA: tRNA (N6-isopentenyl adenosine(37)-C2)-methylthiotransferase MiaB [Desulfurivibrio alkaliphilus]|uniref:tRNA-2-methylthio-N(6)-dimethylallyladenosine synthase n=1 Tax=Desulfurivibrio alkaliphilus TaxID=427923 RepID=A0A7C2XZF2_9BACT|nr:tRNA (N6-isopentenyl adenosine(37)-C2)-methylthiotransferase MiaB [Desulfurivibrio alkaliphilus]
MSKNLYIETFGCQMNERDSEIMAQLLGEDSYLETSSPEEADCIVVNTCSIRGKAAQKAYSLLGGYRALKERNPDLVIAVTGCVAQQDGAGLLARMPHLDLVVGPQNIYRLPELVAAARDRAIRTTAVELSPSFAIPAFLPKMEGNQQSSPKRFVTIMQGCNNFCTYCVVPHTRGREISRRAEEIIDEVRHLADHGVREITLLGQNVNSYGLDQPAGDRTTFPALLRLVAREAGISRIRFTTSHPKDLSPELMACLGQLDKLCPHFHLPVQSGSDRILARMNRKYTRAAYLEKVDALRRACPEIAITTDIIVGFPGESEADFELTMELLELVRYDSAFSFKYSDRPKAAAADFPDKVAEEVKSARLARLQARQEEISQEIIRGLVGKTAEVMVEGKSKAAGNQWSGRTPENRIVNFPSDRPLHPGQLLRVILEEACRHSLRGRLIS